MVKNILLPSIITLLLGYIALYLMEYTVSNNKGALEADLNQQLVDIEELEIIEMKRIHPTNYLAILFEYGQETGHAKYRKGWNNQFSYAGAGYGNSTVSYDYIKTNEGIFGILNGENPEMMIERIEVVQHYGGFHYSVNVSEDKHILEYVQLPSDLKSVYPADITYYNKDGKDITLKILKH